MQAENLSCGEARTALTGQGSYREDLLALPQGILHLDYFLYAI